MATVVNFIDTTLQAAAARTVNLPTAQVLLPPSAIFHVTTGGVGSPTSFTFAPTLIDLAGTISFACIGGTLTNVTATSADLTYANMGGAAATITASITVNGATFSAPCAISKVVDGAAGPTGPTGSTGSTGSTGATGGTGAEGASYVTAYCATTIGTGTSAPTATTGRTSLPAANSGGLTGTYSATVPTLTAGQYQMQSDGIYNPATNQIAWSIPYQSSLKVGSISALSANLGAMTAGSIDIGTGTTSWHVDTSGNTWAGASSYASAPYRVSNAGAAVFTNITIMTGASTIIDATGLKAGYEAPDTKNSDQTLGALGFTGDKNATSDITLTGRGLDVSGNTLIKSAGTAGWNADAFSSESYAGGAYVTATVAAVSDLMFGLNADPISSTNEGSLDYAIQINSSGQILYFEQVSGANAVIGTYVVGDALSVKFDGSSVIYMKGGAILHTTSTFPASPLYFDCSFYGVGAKLTAIRFGPLSSNAWDVIGGSRKAADNATVGAPSGTYVGGTLAQNVESNAAAGAAANAALAYKLNSNAANILSGGAGLTAGTLTYDSSGNRTGGFGIAFNQRGIVGYNSSGTATLTMNASTGDITIAGTLTAASVIAGVVASSLVTQASSGAAAKTQLTTPITGRGAGGNMSNLTVTSGGTAIALGSRTAVGTGGVGPYKYFWRLDGDSHISISGSNTGSTVSFKATGVAGDAPTSTAYCDITDAGSNLTGMDSLDIAVNFI